MKKQNKFSELELVLTIMFVIFFVATIILSIYISNNRIVKSDELVVPKIAGFYQPLTPGDTYSVAVFDSRLYKQAEFANAVKMTYAQLDQEALQKLGIKR